MRDGLSVRVAVASPVHAHQVDADCPDYPQLLEGVRGGRKRKRMDPVVCGPLFSTGRKPIKGHARGPLG